MTDVGLQKLEKYADMYGLTEPSGVEIEESAPRYRILTPFVPLSGRVPTTLRLQDLRDTLQQSPTAEHVII